MEGGEVQEELRRGSGERVDSVAHVMTSTLFILGVFFILGGGSSLRFYLRLVARPR